MKIELTATQRRFIAKEYIRTQLFNLYYAEEKYELIKMLNIVDVEAKNKVMAEVFKQLDRLHSHLNFNENENLYEWVRNFYVMKQLYKPSAN